MLSVRSAIRCGRRFTLLDELPDGFAKPAGLGLATIGGAVGNELRAAALTRLADHLYDIYGTNEAGFISLRRMGGPEGVGVIAPTVRVEVVDDADMPLPEGAEGWVRVAVGKTLDRKGNPLTMKLSGVVEPYFRDVQPA